MAATTSIEHQAEIHVIADDVIREVKSVARRADTIDIDAWWRRAGPGLERQVQLGYGATATLAARYLVTAGALHGFDVDPVQMVVDAAQIATSLLVTGPVAFKKNMTRSGDPGLARRAMATQLAGAANRLTLAGSRETTIATAASSPALIGYRRVARAGACRFCLMLASRDAAYLSRRSAQRVVGERGRTRGTRPLGEQFHDHCRCRVEEVWSDGSAVDVTDPEPDETEVIDPAPVVVQPPPPPPPPPPDPMASLAGARQQFQATPRPGVYSQVDADGNVVPTPAMDQREALRLQVGAEADQLIADRLRSRGVLTAEEATAAHADAWAKYKAAERALENLPDTASTRERRRAERAFWETDRAMWEAADVRDRALGNWAREWQVEFGRVLDDVGLRRGGVPASSVATNAASLSPQIQRRLQQAVDAYPASWARRATGVDAFEVVHAESRAWMQARHGGQRARMNLATDQHADVIIHEFAHQMENLSPEIRLAEWAWYWRRAGGDQLQSLNQVVPGGSYRPDEETRVDQWASAYMGKPYAGAGPASNYELLSMAAQLYLSTTTPDRVDKFAAAGWADDDMRRWFAGVLLTA